MTRALASRVLLAGVALAARAWPHAGNACRCRSEPSFRLGDAGVLCTAQVKPTDPRLTGIFDRAYLLTCRDAAAPVGSVIAVRRAVDLAREPSALPAGAAGLQRRGKRDDRQCRRGAGAHLPRRSGGARLPPLRGPARQDLLFGRRACRIRPGAQAGAGVGRHRPRRRRARCRSPRPKSAIPPPSPGSRRARSTPPGARIEAYTRNNAGRFAESAEFFESLASREDNEPASLGRSLGQPGLAAVEPRQFRRGRATARPRRGAPAREATA